MDETIYTVSECPEELDGPIWMGRVFFFSLRPGQRLYTHSYPMFPTWNANSINLLASIQLKRSSFLKRLPFSSFARATWVEGQKEEVTRTVVYFIHQRRMQNLSREGEKRKRTYTRLDLVKSVIWSRSSECRLREFGQVIEECSAAECWLLPRNVPQKAAIILSIRRASSRDWLFDLFGRIDTKYLHHGRQCRLASRWVVEANTMAPLQVVDLFSSSPLELSAIKLNVTLARPDFESLPSLNISGR